MGWKQVIREIDRANRRSNRAAAQRHRQMVRSHAQLAKLEAKQAALAAAQAEVEEFESYLEMLVSVHKDCGERWHWDQVSKSKGPEQPKPSTALQDKAASALQAYVPGFFAKLFGGAKKQIAELEAGVNAAAVEDQRNNDSAQAQYQQHLAAWFEGRKIAGGVLSRDPAAYKSALKFVDSFGEIEDFKTRVTVAHAEPDVVVLSGSLTDEDLVPREELKLTASGKVSQKNMPATRYWTLYQDYVCSCALRVARETFAALPVDRVIVNVSSYRMDSSTGHHSDMTILAVHFTRNALAAVNMETIDPSDSLRNFNCRMKFKKSSGFDTVEPITADDQWISA